MDRRLHLCVDGGGLALCRRRHRSVLPARGRLVDEHRNDSTARHRRSGDGNLATWQARRAAASLRSWQSIQQRAVPAADGGSWCRLLDEPLGQCLGQCSDGELLLLAQDRTNSAQDVPFTGRGEGRCVRLHRMLLQSETPALDDRLYEPYGIREAGGISLGGCQPNRVQASAFELSLGNTPQVLNRTRPEFDRT